MTIDEILKKLREELDITQEQLARDLNVSFATLNRWENSHTKPSRLAKMRIIDYCKQTSVSEKIITALENVKR